MNLKFTRLMLVLVIVSLTAVCFAGSHEPQLLKECPGGKLYQSGSQRVMLLSGSPYQMGYAHGKLLGDDVKKTVRLVLGVCRAADAMKEKDFFAGSIEKAWAAIKPHVPKRYLDEMRGLSDGAGVPLEDIYYANVFPALFHCSGFALFGKATKDGQLLHGRVLDYMTQIGLQTNDVLLIQSPKGLNTFVNVSYAGFIGSVTGMNTKQVAIGEMGGRGEGQWDGLAMPFLFRKALEEADTMDEAVEVFRNSPRTCEYYYVISDGKIPDARGLYCTATEFEVVIPGTAHPKIPKVFPDVLTFSAGDRLPVLIERVEKDYGKFDPQKGMELMTRPVAMKSNLHDVLFAPQTLELYVAHAGANPAEEKFQACYQEYHHYNINELLSLMPDAAEGETTQNWMELSNRLDKGASEPLPLSGRVPATVFRPIKKADNGAMASKLERFAVDPQAFDWSMTLKKKSGSCEVYDVKFPSPYESPVEQNNTVYGEYFQADGNGTKPAVIVLHILDGRFVVARIVCQQLAAAGINALMVKLPYYGQRRPADAERYQNLTESPQALANGVVQGVMDVRRAARWLSVRKDVDPNKIGLVGVSLGGFVAATTAGVDGMFPKVATIIAGGDLPEVFRGNSHEVQTLRKGMDKEKWSDEQITALLGPIDPLTYADRMKSSQVLMVNATKDAIVPVKCAKKLADKSGAKLLMFPADHYKIAVFLPMIMNQMTQHFSNWK